MASKKQKIDENEKENIGQLNLQNDDDEEMEEKKSQESAKVNKEEE